MVVEIQHEKLGASLHTDTFSYVTTCTRTRPCKSIHLCRGTSFYSEDVSQSLALDKPMFSDRRDRLHTKSIPERLWWCIQLEHFTPKSSSIGFLQRSCSQNARHWMCIHVANGYEEYFDSFGCRPNVVFEHYLNRHCSSWNNNDRQLQSVVSKFCGHYCIYYCILRSNGVNMRKIVTFC